MTTLNICEKCSTKYESESFDLCGTQFELRARLCESCQQRMDAQEESDRRKQRVKKAVRNYLKSVQPRYQATKIEHPEFNRALHDEFSRWDPTSDQPFLVAIGESGESKTRCAYLKGLEFAETGRNTLFSRASDFSHAVQNRFGVDGYRFQKQIQDATRADVLVFDDLGKANPTQAVSYALFHLIDERYARSRPTILTMNLSIPETIKPFTSEFSGPIGGRIVDSSKIIEV